MADDLRILIRAELDEALSAQRMNTQIQGLSSQIKQKVQIQAEIDEKSFQENINRQIGKSSGKGSGKVSVPVGIDIKTDTLKRELAITSDTLKKNLEKVGTSLDWTKFNTNFSKGTLASLQQAKKELGILQKQYQNFNAGVTKIQPFSAVENLNKYISNLSSQTGTLQTKFAKLRTAIPDNVTNSFKELYAVQSKLSAIPTSDITARSTEYNKARKIIDDLSNSYKYLYNQERQQDTSVTKNTFLEKQQKALLSLENLRVKYSKFTSDPQLNAQYNNLASGIIGATSEKELQNANVKAQEFEQTLIGMGKASRSFGDELTNNIKKMGTWMLLGGMLASIIRGFKQVVTNVKDLDQSMTELKKVTDLTDSSYTAFLERSTAKAIKLGAAITDVVDSVATFAKLGYGLSDAEQLGEVATVYLRIADGVSNIDEATKSVVSTMKAFGIAAKDSMSIADKYNEVGRHTCP